MCGIGGILRIVKPGEPDYPADPDDPLRSPSGAWLWHGLDVRDLAYAPIDLGAPARPAGQAVPSHAASPKPRVPSWLISESWLDAIDDGIKWRGPDGAGRFRDRVIRPDGSIVEVALVHRRLSIIDIACGAQPMVQHRCPRCAALASSPAPGGRGAESSRRRGSDPASPEPQAANPLSAIVFNGCIYNHRELRAELEAKGHVFESDHSDTEVILHAVREWESECGQRLDAMFAFLLWNRSNGTLLAARDGFGEKPLYHSWVPFPEAVLYSSAPLPLLSVSEAIRSPETHPLLPSVVELDGAALVDWSTLGFGVGSVPWTSIGEFSPNDAVMYGSEHDRPRIDAKGAALIGAQLTIAAADRMVFGGISKLVHSLDHAAPRPLKSIDGLEQLVEAAVGSRLDADVPLGCFLSGGIDSSLIAHYAQRQLGTLTTLTVRMPDERYDESHHAARIAELLGTHHVVLDCDSGSAADDLVHVIETIALPFADSSILPTYWLCRAAGDHVKVALAGDGGDELFYGYDRYRASWIITLGVFLFPSWFDRADPRSRSERLARLATAARSSNWYWELLAIFQRPDRRKLFGKAKGHICRDPAFPGSIDPRLVDLQAYLPCDLLRKVDSASLMNGIEVRCPLLAKALSESAVATGRRRLTRGGPKGMLRELARKHLPREIVDRPKQGFAIPISDWWRTNFGGLQELLLDMLAGDKPFGRVHDVLEINTGFVRQMLDEHWAAGGLTPLHTTRHVRKRDHGQRLFALVSLAIWARSMQRRDAEFAANRI